MLGADVREVKWSWGYEKIFLFLGIHPLHNAFIDEILEGFRAITQSIQVRLGENQTSAIENQEWAKDSPLVRVDENITIG